MISEACPCIIGDSAKVDLIDLMDVVATFSSVFCCVPHLLTRFAMRVPPPNKFLQYLGKVYQKNFKS